MISVAAVAAAAVALGSVDCQSTWSVQLHQAAGMLAAEKCCSDPLHNGTHTVTPWRGPSHCPSHQGQADSAELHSSPSKAAQCPSGLACHLAADSCMISQQRIYAQSPLPTAEVREKQTESGPSCQSRQAPEAVREGAALLGRLCRALLF